MSRREATTFIKMIFVSEDFRRRGIATALLDELYELYFCVTKLVTDEILPGGRSFFTRYTHRGHAVTLRRKR